MPDNKQFIKGRAILFHTPNEAVFKKIKISDGLVIVDDKEFMVNKIHAINLKSGTGTRPLYMFSHHSLIPAGFEERNDTIDFEPTGDEKTDIKNYIEFVKKLKKAGHTGKVIETNKWVYNRIVPIKTKFLKTKFSPHLLKELGEMRFLKNMKTYSQGKGSGGGFNIMYVLLAFGGGLVWAIILLFLLGYIKTL